MSLPGFVDCPTCGGFGLLDFERDEYGRQIGAQQEFCPDCVAGQVPSPETVEAVSPVLLAFARWDWMRRDAARAALLEYARHVQEGEK